MPLGRCECDTKLKGLCSPNVLTTSRPSYRNCLTISFPGRSPQSTWPRLSAFAAAVQEAISYPSKKAFICLMAPFGPDITQTEKRCLNQTKRRSWRPGKTRKEVLPQPKSDRQPTSKLSLLNLNDPSLRCKAHHLSLVLIKDNSDSSDINDNAGDAFGSRSKKKSKKEWRSPTVTTVSKTIATNVKKYSVTFTDTLCCNVVAANVTTNRRPRSKVN